MAARATLVIPTHAGNPASYRSAPFTPSGMLLRGVLLGGAQDLSGAVATQTYGRVGVAPDRFQGFGRIDLEASVPLPGVSPANWNLQVRARVPKSCGRADGCTVVVGPTGLQLQGVLNGMAHVVAGPLPYCGGKPGNAPSQLIYGPQ